MNYSGARPVDDDDETECGQYFEPEKMGKPD